MTRGDLFRWTSSLGLLVLFGILAVGSSDSGGSASRSGGSSPEHDKIEAFTICQQFAEGRLKAPRTAQWGFGVARDHTTHLGEGKYEVETYVDAQNGFGAMIRSQVDCTVQYQRDGKWSLENLVIH